MANDPKTGARIIEKQADSPSSPIPLSASDLARLEGMTREELLALAKRMACQCGLVAAMTREETAQAMLDVLAETALKSNPNDSSMKVDIEARMRAIDRWLDRERGKPAQTVNQNVTMSLSELVLASYDGGKVIENNG